MQIMANQEKVPSTVAMRNQKQNLKQNKEI